MFIAEQMTETLLRERVAQWVRTALGELVEDSGEQSTMGALQICYHSEVKGASIRDSARTHESKKEVHHAYTCS